VKTAIYPGTFDPITRGHLSVIERASRLFERLLIVVAINPQKQPLFPVEERLHMIDELSSGWPTVASGYTDGYVVDFARRHGARYLVRGVRSCTEIEVEIALANANRELAPEIETVFIPAHPELSEVSSSRLKELALGGADLARYCPLEVARRLRERLSAQALELCHG
jgi:pantetheine-phosphate adenylyltransferase